MKYEITKGSEKDFEQAPEWAMVLLKHNNGRCVFAESKSKGARRTEMYSAGYCIIVVPNEFEIIAERRPITEPLWDGEYPIPAGINLEVHFEGDDSRVWTEFRVEYMRGDVVVLYDYRSDNVESYSNARLSFRPIRSPEDVARDEAIESMAEIIEYRTGCSPKPLARWLYEAGYRKME